MPKPVKTKQVTVYLTLDLAKKLEQEGIRRRRKMGPTVVEILIDFFEQKEAEADFLKAANVNAS
jgi:hypothetical protein